MRIPDIRCWPWKNIDLMFVGVLDVIDGFSWVLTLGCYSPDLSMDYLFWRSLKMLEQHPSKQSAC